MSDALRDGQSRFGPGSPPGGAQAARLPGPDDPARAAPGRGRLAVKRTIDVGLAGIGLVLIAPFGFLIALAIRIASPGPAVFRQTRVGQHGATFMMFKFRTMIDDAELTRAELEVLNESDGIFKLKDDPRLTGIGRVLRRGSLDELPQLINVLRGEMSLVGPRPLVPEEDRRIQGPYRARLGLRPGMTGPWQALGPVRPTLREMVVIDCLYVETWSLRSDVKILLQTFAHVARLRGI